MTRTTKYGSGSSESRPCPKLQLGRGRWAGEGCVLCEIDESVDLAIRLGVDPRHADQNIRGATILPHGTGKSARVVVFARGEKAMEAEAAGADVVGAEDLVEKIQKGWMDFDKTVATPDMMALVGGSVGFLVLEV